MNETGRLEMFSDGVLAIAITLLVLDLKLPPHEPGQHLTEALADHWPAYLAYVVSFLVIGIIWVNHHAMFTLIARVDRGLLFVNLLLLMIVAMLPFPTALMSEYLREGEDSHVAAAVYSTTMLAMSLAYVLMWWYVTRSGRLLYQQLDRTTARKAMRRFGLGLIIYAITIGLAFIDATVTLVAHLLIALYYCFDQLAVRNTPATPSDEDALEPQRVPTET